MAFRVARLCCVVLAACTSAGAPYDDVLVYDYIGDAEHAVRPVAIPSLTSTDPMRGELGAVTRGGRITGDEVLQWTQGAPVTLSYVVDDRTLVPTDETGLVLTSFYHHLEAVRDDLGGRGWADDMQAIFPVTTISWTPEQLTGDAIPVENAAYASAGLNVFVLFEDGNQRVPLGAHAGVVRHEFGHAWFAQLVPVVGQALLNSEDEALFEDPRAANEGFADIVAILSLDDPGAIPFAERDPRLDHSSADYSGNAYDLGVALAAFVWDMRLVTDDPEDALVRSVDALVDWAERVVAEEVPGESLSYAITLHDAFAPRVNEAVLCERYRARFPTEPTRCAP